jgi:hypothetical protein
MRQGSWPLMQARCLPFLGPLPLQFFEEVWRARARAGELCTTATLEYGPPEWSESGFDSVNLSSVICFPRVWVSVL